MNIKKQELIRIDIKNNIVIRYMIIFFFLRNVNFNLCKIAAMRFLISVTNK